MYVHTVQYIGVDVKYSLFLSDSNKTVYVCIVVILCAFVVLCVYCCSCLVCIVLSFLACIVVLCVYCCFYFRCRTAG